MKSKNYFFSSKLLKSFVGSLVLLCLSSGMQVSFADAPEVLLDFISVPENTTDVRTPISASDPEDDPITFAMAGEDADKFDLDATSGNLSFKEAPDFEKPGDKNENNVYIIDVTVTDNEMPPLSGSRRLSITVTDVPEVEITQGSVTVSENTLIVVEPVAILNPGSLVIKYSISGGVDAGVFTIGEASGNLAFTSPPDFENPTDGDGSNPVDQLEDNIYEVEITVTDSNGLTDSKIILVFVTDIATVMDIEEPSAAFPRSGIANIRGWAVSFSEIDKIELFIDGVYVSNIPSGATRRDVGIAFPTIPNSEKSGFSMAFAYSSLARGNHTILVRVHDVNGGVEEQSSGFSVVRFDNPFMSNPRAMTIKNSEINIVEIIRESGSDSSSGKDGVLIKGLEVEGKKHSVLLEWQTATQQFEITAIKPETGLLGLFFLSEEMNEEETNLELFSIESLGERLVVKIEEPAKGEVSNGIANLRGWAVGLEEIQKIELFLGDKYLTDVPFGGLREDVADDYPGYLHPEKSGFSMAFPYSALERGNHTFTVRVHDASGLTKDASVRFPTVRLDSEFISSVSDVNLTAASIRVRRDNEKIIIDNFSAQGEKYELVLKWRPATQQFEIQAISKMATDDDDGLLGGGPKLGSL